MQEHASHVRVCKFSHGDAVERYMRGDACQKHTHENTIFKIFTLNMRGFVKS